MGAIPAREYFRQTGSLECISSRAVIKMRARVSALTDRLLGEIPGIEKPSAVSEEVAALITERCNDYRSRFSKK